MEDVIVIGGGVIGLSISLELARQGAAVAILDQADFGREASWAGAGILPPGNRDGADTPESQLRALSHSLWHDWAEALYAETGHDIGYTRCGGLEVVRGGGPNDLHHEVRAWRREKVQVEEISSAALSTLEPRLSQEIGAAYRLPDLGQVRNPRLVRALVAACAGQGIRMYPGTPAVGFDEQDGKIRSVHTPTGLLAAGRFCVAGGPWSRSIVAGIAVDLPVEPVRGQIVLVSHVPRLFSHVVQVGPRYLVPRADGKVLIGATEEHVGFLKANTPAAVSALLAFGISLVPALAEARFERAWSGLRPGSPNGYPFLGPVNGYANLFIAAGHFRSGLQMSPGTARLLRQSILEQPTDLLLDQFSIDRLVMDTSSTKAQA